MKDMKMQAISDDMLENVTGGADMEVADFDIDQYTVIKKCEICGGDRKFLVLSGGREKCTGCGEIKSVM